MHRGNEMGFLLGDDRNVPKLDSGGGGIIL